VESTVESTGAAPTERELANITIGRVTSFVPFAAARKRQDVTILKHLKDLGGQPTLDRAGGSPSTRLNFRR